MCDSPSGHLEPSNNPATQANNDHNNTNSGHPQLPPLPSSSSAAAAGTKRAYSEDQFGPRKAVIREREGGPQGSEEEEEAEEEAALGDRQPSSHDKKRAEHPASSQAEANIDKNEEQRENTPSSYGGDTQQTRRSQSRTRGRKNQGGIKNPALPDYMPIPAGSSHHTTTTTESTATTLPYPLNDDPAVATGYGALQPFTTAAAEPGPGPGPGWPAAPNTEPEPESDGGEVVYTSPAGTGFTAKQLEQYANGAVRNGEGNRVFFQPSFIEELPFSWPERPVKEEGGHQEVD